MSLKNTNVKISDKQNMCNSTDEIFGYVGIWDFFLKKEELMIDNDNNNKKKNNLLTNPQNDQALKTNLCSFFFRNNSKIYKKLKCYQHK